MRECKWFTKKVEYLVHVIKPGKLENDYSLTEFLRRAHSPKSESKLWPILGIAKHLSSLCRQPYVRNRVSAQEATKKASKRSRSQMWQSAPFREKNLWNPFPARSGPLQCQSSLFRRPRRFSVRPQLLISTNTLGGESSNSSMLASFYFSRNAFILFLNENFCNSMGSQSSPLLCFVQEFIVHTKHATLRWLLPMYEPVYTLKQWRFRRAKNNFWIIYIKASQDVHVDAIPWLIAMQKTIANELDGITFFCLKPHRTQLTSNFLNNASNALDTPLPARTETSRTWLTTLCRKPYWR